jgi:hypothetical protein
MTGCIARVGKFQGHEIHSGAFDQANSHFVFTGNSPERLGSLDPHQGVAGDSAPLLMLKASDRLHLRLTTPPESSTSK